jgi:inner membrane protein
MFLAHTGITLGAATLLAGAVKGQRHSPEKVSWFNYLWRRIDIRVLLVGSLLPDIIDKPIGDVFFWETFHNGRIFAHTLLFLVLLAAAGFYLYKRHRQLWGLTLAFGTLMHLILDEMWQAPATLFWPLLGFTFAGTEEAPWLWHVFEVFASPIVVIGEAVGLAVLIWFGLTLAGRKKVLAFIRYGKLD